MWIVIRGEKFSLGSEKKNRSSIIVGVGKRVFIVLGIRFRLGRLGI